MMQLRNIKTVWKITILILFMAAFLALVGYVGHYAANTLAGKMDDMYKNRLLPIQWLNDSRVESRRNESLTFALFMAKDPTEQQRINKQIEEHKKLYSSYLDQYKQSELSEVEKQNLEKIAAETQVYRTTWQKSIDLAMAGKSEEGHDYFYKEAFPHLEAINKLLDDMVTYNDKMAEDEKHKSEELAVYNDRISMGITVLAVLLSALLGWVITRLLVVPLNGLLAEVHRMTGGDLKNRAVHTVYYDDEVGQLTKEFDTMAGHLHRLVKNISEATQQLAESSSSLNLGAEEAAKVTEQITGSVENVAEGAEHQSQLIDKTTLGVQQMAAAIDQVGNNSMAVAQSVAKTVEAATAGEKSAESVKEQMNAIETTVESSAVAVKKLGERSQEIGQIVDTISGIAGQTNLLALNAAIEAARAGENGKGFAVVAEEVRKLAEQSKDAAAKIAAMISEIQQETEKAVIAMNKGSEEVKLGADVVEGAGKNFRDINSLVNAVSMQTTEISAAIEEMMANSQEIEHAVKDIDKVGKQAVGKTQTVSAATEEHAASIEEILAASENLAATAKSLQQAVEFFKV